jgi:DNA-binding protein HU-beta/integration host factor subunit alpha
VAIDAPAGEIRITTMATITKRELVIRVTNSANEKIRDELHEKLGEKFNDSQAQKLALTQYQVSVVVQELLEATTEELANGNSVVMRNFGAFQVKETKSKIGRNPKDPGRDVVIPPRAVVKFKPGREMKEKVAQVLPKLREQETA